MTLTQSKVAEFFDYKDGQLFWKISTGRVSAFSKAGTLGSHGYLQIRLMGKIYLAHRLIYLLINGHIPNQIDHIDGDKTNNKIDNLRLSSQSENRMNSSRSSLNKIGIKGVCWSKSNKSWRVQIKKQRKNVYDGFFNDLELAELVSIEARNKYHGLFARHDSQ
jgi:hypothetical protein